MVEPRGSKSNPVSNCCGYHATWLQARVTHTRTHTYRQHQSNSRRSLLIGRSLSVILCTGTATERLVHGGALARWLAGCSVDLRQTCTHAPSSPHGRAVSSAVHAADRCSSAPLSVYVSVCLSVCQALLFRGVTSHVSPSRPSRELSNPVCSKSGPTCISVASQ